MDKACRDQTNFSGKDWKETKGRSLGKCLNRPEHTRMMEYYAAVQSAEAHLSVPIWRAPPTKV